MVTQELVDYIKAQLKDGKDKAYIKTELLNSSWKEEDINQAFLKQSQRNIVSVAERQVPIPPALLKGVEWPKSSIRITFGIIWLVDAYLKWQPMFIGALPQLLSDAAKDQPSWLLPWFNFWIDLVINHVLIFVYTSAIIETYLAITLIFGFARKTTYIISAIWALLIWATAEGFGGFYMLGAVDIGAASIYAVVSLVLLVLNIYSGKDRYSVDFFIEKKIPWWAKIAEM